MEGPATYAARRSVHSPWSTACAVLVGFFLVLFVLPPLPLTYVPPISSKLPPGVPAQTSPVHDAPPVLGVLPFSAPGPAASFPTMPVPTSPSAAPYPVSQASVAPAALKPLPRSADAAPAGLRRLVLLNPEPWLVPAAPAIPTFDPTAFPTVLTAADPAPAARTVPAAGPGQALAADTPEPPPPPTIPVQPPARFVALKAKLAALTFDDGPFDRLTEQYLAALAAKNVKATFFLVGSRARRYPTVVQQIASQGHELANHSWRHADMAAWEEETIGDDLAATNTILQENGAPPPRLFRAPYGRWSPEVLRRAAAAGLEAVAWSVDPQDWREPAPESIVARVRNQLHPGAIIILHEGHRNTAKALPLLLAALEEEGYRLVTVSELLAAGEAVRAPAQP